MPTLTKTVNVMLYCWHLGFADIPRWKNQPPRQKADVGGHNFGDIFMMCEMLLSVLWTREASRMLEELWRTWVKVCPCLSDLCRGTGELTHGNKDAGPSRFVSTHCVRFSGWTADVMWCWKWKRGCRPFTICLNTLCPVFWLDSRCHVMLEVETRMQALHDLSEHTVSGFLVGQQMSCDVGSGNDWQGSLMKSCVLAVWQRPWNGRPSGWEACDGAVF